MIENFECIVKTAKDNLGNILWRAIYVKGKKEMESFNIDLDKVLFYYAPNGKWKEVIFIEKDTQYIYDYIQEFFPDIEEFLELMDYTELYEGKIVYLPTGEHIVEEIWYDIRKEGEYNYWHWENIDGKWYSAKFKQYYEEHDVIKFKIINSDEEFIWEDLNYQQSFLYIYSRY